MTSCTCPKCGTFFSYEQNLEGQKVRCMNCKLALIGPPHGSQNAVAEPHPSEEYEPFKPFETPAPIAVQTTVSPTRTAAQQKVASPPLTQKKSSRAKFVFLTILLIALGGVAWWQQNAAQKTTQESATQTPESSENTENSTLLADLPPAEAMQEILPQDEAHENLKPSERVTSYDEALARAKATGNDIVVYQYGSDWNRLSLHLYKNVWATDAFLKSLGKGYIILAVDNQETLGAQPMPLGIQKKGNIRTGTTFFKESPTDALNAQATSSKGKNELNAVFSSENVLYTQDNDGYFSIHGGLAVPASDTIKLTLVPSTSGKFIRVDFPAGSTPFVGGCSGLASNGNFALSAVRVSAKNNSGTITALEAKVSSEQWTPATLPINGSTKPGCWNAAAHLKQTNTLIITLDQELRAKEIVTIELEAATQFGSHIPGAVRACVTPDLAKAQDYATVPASELTSVASVSGALPFARQQDGSFYAQISPNPGTDELILKLNTTTTGNIIRLDFPRDTRVPNGGVGRAGNAVISEAIVLVNGKEVKAQHAWGNSGSRGGFSAYTAIDGITDKTGEGWNLNGGEARDKALFITLPQAVTGEIDVKLLCKSQWNSHIPTRIAARVLNDKTLETSIASLSTAEALEQKNAPFDWNDRNHCPRIALMDATGRAVACEDYPRIDLTPAKMAKRVHDLRKVREERDALWAKAEQATGPDKARLLVEGMKLIRRHIGDTTGIGLWDGNSHCYAPILKSIEEADPKNESWAQLIFRTGLDHRCGIAALDPALRQAGARDYASEAGEAQKAGDFAKAISIYDEMLAHPNFKQLDLELQQQILLAKFNTYRAWQGHEAQATDVLREMAALSNDTTIGIAAQGIYDYTHTPAKPENFAYGWGGQQLKPGVNHFEFTRGLDIQFTAPGPYQLCISRRSGNDSVKIEHVALYDGDTLLAEAKPSNNEISATTPLLQIPLRIDPKQWSKTQRKLRLKMQVSAVAAAANATAADFPVNMQATRMLDDIALVELPKDLLSHTEILKSLNETLEKNTNLKDKQVRLALAQREFITECGPHFLDAFRQLPGGHDLLNTFGRDVDWLEEFLTSDPPSGSFSLALENMRVLRNHGADLEIPVYQRLATAMALTAGNINECQLIEAYNNYHKAHREMLLYRDFDTLDVRSLRTVVDFSTPQDFNFVLNDRQVTPGSALGACHSIWYMTSSAFGGSIFGGGYLNCFYHTPWSWRFKVIETIVKSGGVCGSLSTYGSIVARIHGIQAHNVGQPAHCAYVVRIGKGWPVGNYVAGPTGCGVPGWDGVGYNTAATLHEPVKQDRTSVLNAARLTWLTHWKRDQGTVNTLSYPSAFSYAVYDWRGNGMPDFSKMQPIKSGKSTWPSAADLVTSPPVLNTCAAVWESEFKLQNDADITCILQGCHEAHLFINDQEVVGIINNLGKKTIPLPAGTHKIKLTYLHLNEKPMLTLQLKAEAKSGPWQRGYEDAVAAHPKNYAIWLEYIRAISSTKPLDQNALKSMTVRIAKNFKQDPEAAWTLIHACTEPLKSTVTPLEMGKLFRTAHHHLIYSEHNTRYPEGFDMGNVLAWQVGFMPDLEMQMAYASSILRLHFSEDAAKNAYFGSMLNWTNNAYGNRPETAEKYSTMLGGLFRSMAKNLDPNTLNNTLDGGIRNAATRGDLPSYRNWLVMAKKWGPAVDVRMDEMQTKLNAEHAQPFAGTLLSPNGLIQCSAPSSVFAYSALTNEGDGAFFHVNKMKNPWITLQLGGESEVSGIVIVGHLESFKDQLPLKVSVSMDNQTWTEVANITTYTPSIRVDLAGKNIKARYVRLERPADAPDQFIHLRNFLIYGKPLY